MNGNEVQINTQIAVWLVIVNVCLWATNECTMLTDKTPENVKKDIAEAL